MQLSAFATASLPSLLTNKYVDSNATTDRPNFLIILTDDQGWGDLGCFGHTVIQTPNLDRLAAEGCRFTNFYSASPVCAPARAALLTGRLPDRYGLKFLCHNGQYDAPIYHHVPTTEPSLPRHLQQVGYKTCHVGKWHLSIPGLPGEPTPSDYGFDHYLILPPKGTGIYKEPQNWNRNGEIISGKIADWTPDLCVNETIEFIATNKTNPFFVNLWTFTPHEDIVCEESFADLYKRCTTEEQTYYGALTQFDKALGRLLDYLRAEGLYDKTVILFSSDNGPENPLLPWVRNSAGSTGPFRGSKHVLYEGGIRVPAILRWPHFTAPGTVCHTPMSMLDIFPTFSLVGGASLPNTACLDGVDFRNCLINEPLERARPLYWQYDRAPEEHRHRGALFVSHPLALREGNWKLLCDKEFSSPELYNLAFDLGEKWNLAEKYSNILEAMMGQLKNIYHEVQESERQATGFLNPLMPPPSKEPLVLG